MDNNPQYEAAAQAIAEAHHDAPPIKWRDQPNGLLTVILCNGRKLVDQQIPAPKPEPKPAPEIKAPSDDPAENAGQDGPQAPDMPTSGATDEKDQKPEQEQPKPAPHATRTPRK